jgi:hypothetical protein
MPAIRFSGLDKLVYRMFISAAVPWTAGDSAMHLSSTHHDVTFVSRLLAAALVLNAPLTAHAQSSAPECKAAAPVASVAELPEGSGLAASRKVPGRFWSHNDSGDPALVALGSSGRVTGRLELSGAKVDDWEAVAVGPCPAGSCIYVADIGDNDAKRNHVIIYRVAEPAEASGTAKVSDIFSATYPDGAHDAETLLVTPEGRLYIVTKGDTGPVSLYRFPEQLKNATLRLERVGGPRDVGQPANTDRITDGAVSPDGQWVVLRSTQALMFYRAADLLSGTWRAAARVPVASAGEPQGEGVTFGSDNAIYLMSEGKSKKQPGMLSRITCSLTR